MRTGGLASDGLTRRARIDPRGRGTASVGSPTSVGPTALDRRRIGRTSTGLRGRLGVVGRLGLRSSGGGRALAPVWGLTVHGLGGEDCSENASRCQGGNHPRTASSGAPTGVQAQHRLRGGNRCGAAVETVGCRTREAAGRAGRAGRVDDGAHTRLVRRSTGVGASRSASDRGGSRGTDTTREGTEARAFGATGGRARRCCRERAAIDFSVDGAERVPRDVESRRIFSGSRGTPSQAAD
jgi:hypothetical protein